MKPQRFFLDLGKFGCYVLSLAELARRKEGRAITDVAFIVDKVKSWIDQGYVLYNAQKFFYVLYPDKIISEIYGGTWTVEILPAAEVDTWLRKDDDLVKVVGVFKKDMTLHFCAWTGESWYDPYGHDLMTWKMDRLRVFKKKE